ncbi:MAG: MBL fold metallo-hydrolase [Planctomycetes bacterium]|nr:MBL fold metallo-hydrolase [Planctomycetota bacterium]
MKIKWLGHATFTLVSSQGSVVVTDPFDANAYEGAIKYKPINLKADVVTVTHTQHEDHNYTQAVSGSPQVIDKEGEYETAGIKIKGVPTFHDKNQGQDRGHNIVFVYNIDGVRVAHLGDLGHVPTPEQFKQMGSVDVLLVPVGGHFTIDDQEATRISSQCGAKIVVPMHYKTPVLDFPIASVDKFLQGKKNVKKLDSSEVTITKKNLPAEQEIWVLPYG